MNEYIIPILKQWKNEASVEEEVSFKLYYSYRKLIIYSSKIGYLIGEGGIYASKYLNILKKELLEDNLQIEFEEIDGSV
jgi:hypothetical protein